jgi:hypothetical protein
MPETSQALCAALLITLAVQPALAEAKDAQYIDLTASFVRFVDATVAMEDQPRVALFRKQMDALLPGFYTPRNGTEPARYDVRAAKALKTFEALRPRYEQVQREFPAAFEAGIRHFRKDFPGFTPNVPVYLLHSLGEMDGGTRELNGKVYLIFGADVIAQIHETRDLTAFLDHELFHVEHGKHFPECGEVWCALWAEGLATYAAKVMNPGADDEQLLLATPKPIRAPVDASWPAAACFTRAKLDSSAEEDISVLFQGGPDAGAFPRRSGYYVGLRVAEELGGEFPLAELARMSPQRAKVALLGALDRLITKAINLSPSASSERSSAFCGQHQPW